MFVKGTWTPPRCRQYGKSCKTSFRRIGFVLLRYWKYWKVTGFLKVPLLRSSPGWKRRLSGKQRRSEEHTSELQSLMRISYAVFCLKKKKKKQKRAHITHVQ